jgi:hypothetical protein
MANRLLEKYKHKRRKRRRTARDGYTQRRFNTAFYILRPHEGRFFGISFSHPYGTDSAASFSSRPTNLPFLCQLFNSMIPGWSAMRRQAMLVSFMAFTCFFFFDALRYDGRLSRFQRHPLPVSLFKILLLLLSLYLYFTPLFGNAKLGRRKNA